MIKELNIAKKSWGDVSGIEKHEEEKVADFIDYYINEEGITDKVELIYTVADDIANDYSYENDFDKYQGVDRIDTIYYHYFNRYSKIASKILNDE